MKPFLIATLWGWYLPDNILRPIHAAIHFSLLATAKEKYCYCFTKCRGTEAQDWVFLVKGLPGKDGLLTPGPMKAIWVGSTLDIMCYLRNSGICVNFCWSQLDFILVKTLPRFHWGPHCLRCCYPWYWAPILLYAAGNWCEFRKILAEDQGHSHPVLPQSSCGAEK